MPPQKQAQPELPKPSLVELVAPPQTQERLLRSAVLRRENHVTLPRYANPSADLPESGNGLQVEGRLSGIEIRGAENYPRIRWIAGQAFKQWTRHLTEDPGYVNLTVGYPEDYGCSTHHAACYVYDQPKGFVFLDEVQAGEKESCIGSSNPCVFMPNHELFQEHGDSSLVVDISQRHESRDNLFQILTHEAGHRFDYNNLDGRRDTCGGIGSFECHAPDGSGSVMSYDPDARSDVTREDVQYMGHPNGISPQWNPDPAERYTVSKAGKSGSINEWGVWIDHEFEVTEIGVHDFISATGWINGTPTNTSPTGNATYDGDFLGVDMGADHLGALLRADAGLRYSFDSQTMALTLDRFQVHHGNRWHHQDRSFSYDMTCTSSGCTGNEAQAKWYPNDWVGGVISDQANEYVGSFVAEKDGDDP